MNSKNIVYIGIIVLVIAGSCTSTRYLTDKNSIDRQHEMKLNRTGENAGDVLLNFANLVISIALNSEFEPVQSQRAFKRITIMNQSQDTLFVNMVTDILWKKDEYCDIMGIILPAGAKQKLLVPYSAAYNIYFKTRTSEEEKLEIRTDSNMRIFKLEPGMAKDTVTNKSGQ